MSLKEVNTNVQSSSEINAQVEEWLRQQKIETVEVEKKPTCKLLLEVMNGLVVAPELPQIFNKFEFLRSINYEELVEDSEFYWATFMLELKVMKTLTLEEFNLVYPDLDDEEEPGCLYENNYVSDTNDTGSFDLEWLR